MYVHIYIPVEGIQKPPNLNNNDFTTTSSLETYR